MEKKQLESLCHKGMEFLFSADSKIHMLDLVLEPEHIETLEQINEEMQQLAPERDVEQGGGAHVG
ncbi:MAG: hypothetical protein AAGJ35_05510 [Myxococcota bacterium]